MPGLQRICVARCGGSFRHAFPRSVRQGVDDGDVGVDFDGLAVEDGGAIAPLTDGIESRLNQERIARDGFQHLDGAVGGNDGVEFDAAFAVELNGDVRIKWLDAANQHGCLNRFADSLGFRR